MMSDFKNKLLFFVPIVVLVGLGVWANKNSELHNEPEEEIEVVSVGAIEFSELIDREGVFLLDVHIPEQEHIPGTDAFIPYNEIADNVDKLPEDKDAQILVYCRSGSMSREVAYELGKMGYTNVINLEGGLNAYREVDVSVGMSPESRDLGTVVYGDVATTEFILTNFTPQKLEIGRVSTSCGCTSAKIDQMSLDPYESTVVRVSFDPAVHKDDTDLGEVTRTIYIDTDNPNFKQVTAVIYAKVIKN